MFKTILFATAAFAMLPVSASAATFVVNANANTIGGNVGVSSIALTAGQAFTVTVAPGQLWAAGAVPRWSDADGLTKNLFASGSDVTGLPSGTLIGQNWGFYTQDGVTAPYGILMGRIGSTLYQLGTNYSGVASTSGTLDLFYWDANIGDNIGSITANVTAVPEPATWAMMLTGFGLTGFALRRRSSKLAQQSA